MSDTMAERPQQVPVNMYEAEHALVVVAPLPGVMAEDILITVEETVMSITANARTEAPKEYLLHEWHYGPYERRIDIPPGWDGEGSASFGNGQLAIRLTKGDGSAVAGGGGVRQLPITQR